jgi:hypothetical protein
MFTNKLNASTYGSSDNDKNSASLGMTEITAETL